MVLTAEQISKKKNIRMPEDELAGIFDQLEGREIRARINQPSQGHPNFSYVRGVVTWLGYSDDSYYDPLMIQLDGKYTYSGIELNTVKFLEFKTPQYY